MKMERVIANTGVAAAWGLVMALLNALPSSVKVLLIMMAIDYATGVMHAITEKKLSSEIGFNGILRKIVIMCMLAVGHLSDEMLNANVWLTLVTMFYIGNESISIVENAYRIGVPVPQKLVDMLSQISNNREE